MQPDARGRMQTGRDDVVPWGPVGRKRDLLFADTFLEELQHRDLRGAILAAGRRMGWSHLIFSANDGITRHYPMKDVVILRRGRKILAREGVIEYLKHIYDAIGFSPLDGARKVVEHINGIEYPAMTVTDEQTGEVKTVIKKEKPSVEALKLYFSQTTEEQTKKVQVDSRMLVAHKMISDEPPKMRPRVLKSVTPELTK